jgi:hypothetical protein
VLEGRVLPATTFTVNLNTDTGGPGGQMVTPTSGDLRYCISQADLPANAGSTIDFAISNTTVTLTQGVLTISQNLSIVGPGASSPITVSGNHASGVFDITTGTVTLSGLTIANGSDDAGGGILNDGNLMLSTCTLSGNSAVFGGGIDNRNALTVTDTTLSGNTASDTGGGISEADGPATMTVTNCTLSGNSCGHEGGGLYIVGGGDTAMLSTCTLSHNTASTLGGGGIDNEEGGTVTVTNSTLEANTADGSGADGYGGGIRNIAGTLTLTNSSFTGNSVTGDGGAIFNDNGGTVFDTGCDFTHNFSAQYGGAIRNQLGTMTVTGGNFDNNTAGRNGGAIDNTFNSFAMIADCTLSGNSASSSSSSLGDGDGGAIGNGGTLTLTACTFDHDSASYLGGGIYNTYLIGGTAKGTIAATGCTFFSDSAQYGGGIYNLVGTVTLTNCILSGDTATSLGGGIDNETDGTLTVTNSTLSGNTAVGGGGLHNQGTAVLTNSTVSGNTANALDTAGGIDTSSETSDAGTTLLDCTVAGNINNADGPGGLFAGRYDSGQATVTLHNTIVADNSGNQFGTSGASAPGSFVSLGYNLSSDASGNLLQPGDKQDTIPLLGPLQDNGGSLAGAPGSQHVVPTMALLPGSPAIDAADPNVTGLPATDERGFDRVVNVVPDIGAFEVQVYTVYSPANSGGGSLYNALILANRAGGSVINFTTGPTINLTSALPDITRSVQILGPGANDLTVQRSTAAGTPDFSIFVVDPPHNDIQDVSVVISGLTIANGNSSYGGGIENFANLTVSDAVLTGNSVSGYGGGIYNQNRLTVADSTFSDNSATYGAGIDSQPAGTVTVTNSILTGNSASYGGAGIENGGMMAVTDSSFSGNSATNYGGGIGNYGTMRVTSSTLAGNSAAYAGAISNLIGTVTVTNCTLSGNSATNWGGGIDNDEGGTVAATNCTFSGNYSFFGGGIINESGTATVTNCTLAGNTAYFGGGLYNNSTAPSIGNTILAGNTASVAGPDVYGSVASQGHNLIGDPSASSGFSVPAGDLEGTAASPLAPLLAPLGNYGGPTQTMALLPGSPAIDTGSNALLPAGLTTDQRGFARIVNTVDVGAFESRGFTLTVAGGNNQQALVNTPFATPLSVTVSSPYGEPVQGGVVTFAGQPTGASFSGPNTATINASGQATLSVSANAIAGSYTVEASADGANSPGIFSLTNLPAITLNSTSLPNATAGVTYSQTLTAGGGAGGPYTFAVTAGALPTGFSLSSSGALSGSTTVAGTSSLTVTATDSSGFTGSQAYTLTIDPATATHFLVSAPSSTTAGSAFSFTVKALDPFNNTATGYTGTVHFTSSDGNASLPPANQTLSNGVATFGATLTMAGTQTLTATDTNSITGTSNGVAVSAAAATHFAVSAPSSTTAGSPFRFTVTALDPFNNTATGYGGTVHFTSSDPQAVLPANATLTNGVGTFTVTLKTAGIQSLTATDTANATITGSTNGITVTPGAATHFVITGPSSVKAGSAFSLTVTALDAYGNVATGYLGTVNFASTDNRAQLPGKYAFTASDKGVHPFAGLALKKKGTQTITVTDASNGIILGTFSIDVL